MFGHSYMKENQVQVRYLNKCTPYNIIITICIKHNLVNT